MQYDSARFAPEQHRALRVFDESMQNSSRFDIIQEPTLCFESYCITDYRFFTSDELSTKSLPRGKNWLWNKSKASHVNLSNGCAVRFLKLSIRRSNSSSPACPKCKMWIFYIRYPNQHKITFVWCERGNESVKILPVTLQDLAFLYPFVNPIDASILGWK